MVAKARFANQHDVVQATSGDVKNLMSNRNQGGPHRFDYVMIMDYEGQIDILAEVTFRDYGGYEICCLSEVLTGSLGEIPKYRGEYTYGGAAEYLNDWLDGEADFWEWLEDLRGDPEIDDDEAGAGVDQ